MQPSDVEQVVKVHLSSFPGFFLTFLGPRFLTSLYAYIASSPDGIGYVSIDGTKIVGFVCGSTQPSGFYRRFLFKRWREIIFSVMLTVILKPAIAPRLVWRVITPPQASTEPGTATLLSIALIPQYQKKGVGTALVQEFLNDILRRSIHRVNLTTDRDNNDTVNSFYQRLGFQLVRSFVTPEGRWMNEYAISLNSREPDA